MKVKSESEIGQSCLTLSDPMNCSPPGSSVRGIFQARLLEWVAISFSNAWKWKVKVKSLSRVWLLATPWTAAYQAPPPMGFSRQDYWSGVPLPFPYFLIDLLLNNQINFEQVWLKKIPCPSQSYMSVDKVIKYMYIFNFKDFLWFHMYYFSVDNANKIKIDCPSYY